MNYSTRLSVVTACLTLDWVPNGGWIIGSSCGLMGGGLAENWLLISYFPGPGTACYGEKGCVDVLFVGKCSKINWTSRRAVEKLLHNYSGPYQEASPKWSGCKRVVKLKQKNSMLKGCKKYKIVNWKDSNKKITSEGRKGSKN